MKLSKSDYIEKIEIDGTVQAVLNYPVLPPKRMFGQMTISRLAKDGEYVTKGDTICVLTIPELESMYLDSKTSVENLDADLKKNEADNKLNIALLEAQLATSEAQLKISALDSLKLKFATETNRKLLELEMKKAIIEKAKIEKKLNATKSIAESDVRKLNARLMQEKTKCQAIEDQIKSLTIIAQRDGIVMRTESPTFYFVSSSGIGKMGGPIKEGSILIIDSPILLFPDLSKMQITADVAEADFKKIEKGQKAVITVDASGKLVTTGKVSRKSLAGHTAIKYSNSKVKFYEVIIDIDSCHSKLKPGLSADCEIFLREARDTVCVPTLAIFEKDSSKVVYVKKKNKFSPVKVETGTSGSSQTIISGGLKGDEIIALTRPPAGFIEEPASRKKITQTK